MTIKEVFKKAIEGGLDADELFNEEDEIKALANPELFYLDPLFWQALGKSMGWQGFDKKKWMFECYLDGVKEHSVCLSKRTRGFAFAFYDHLMRGGTPESFFNQL